MDLYIYSDESGVFDRVHNRFFVFGGVIFLSKNERDIASRKYASVEKSIRAGMEFTQHTEIKATTVSNKDKGKLYRSLNNVHKFAVVVSQKCLKETIFASKKEKQRYLDYAYKIAVKRKLEQLISQKIIIPDQVERLFFYIDEHTTATDGIYELKEGLEQEFKYGTHNRSYSLFFPPIFEKLQSVELDFYNSEKKTLIRAADIVANKVFYLNNTGKLSDDLPNNLLVTQLP